MTGGVVVCTLSLHAEGPFFMSWHGGGYRFRVWDDSTFGGAY